MLQKICCYNTDFCKCECLCLSRNKNVKLAYIAFLLTGFIASFIARAALADPSLDTIQAYGCIQAWDKEECVKYKFAEVTFVSIVGLHLVLLCCMFCKNEKVKIINEGLWIVKIIAVISLFFVIKMTVRTVFFKYLCIMTAWGSNLLVVFITMVFIDLVYSLDQILNEWAERNPKVYILKAVMSIITIASAVIICFLSFNYVPLYVFIINTVCLALFFVVTMLRIFASNSLLVYGLIMLYINAVCFYLETSSEQHHVLDQFLSVFAINMCLLLLFGMLCEGGNRIRTRKSTLNELLALNTSKQQEDNRYVSSNKWIIYHCVMIVIAMTIPSMLCLNLQEVDDRLGTQQIRNTVWWASGTVLYIWTLVMMRLLPDKDFSELENYFKEYELS